MPRKTRHQLPYPRGRFLKVLFVTQDRSREITEEALKIGAGVYVVKSDAASELLPSIKAILEGKRFISASLAGHFLVAATFTLSRFHGWLH